MEEEYKIMEEKLFHLELINKLLEAENEELKVVISQFKKFDKCKKQSFKSKLKNTLIYRFLRKIKHFIVGVKK